MLFSSLKINFFWKRLMVKELEQIALAWDSALNVYEACACYEDHLQNEIFLSEFQPHLTIRKIDIFHIIELLKKF